MQLLVSQFAYNFFETFCLHHLETDLHHFLWKIKCKWLYGSPYVKGFPGTLIFVK